MKKLFLFLASILMIFSQMLFAESIIQMDVPEFAIHTSVSSTPIIGANCRDVEMEYIISIAYHKFNYTNMMPDQHRIEIAIFSGIEFPYYKEAAVLTDKTVFSAFKQQDINDQRSAVS